MRALKTLCLTIPLFLAGCATHPVLFCLQPYPELVVCLPEDKYRQLQNESEQREQAPRVPAVPSPADDPKA